MLEGFAESTVVLSVGVSRTMKSQSSTREISHSALRHTALCRGLYMLRKKLLNKGVCLYCENQVSLGVAGCTVESVLMKGAQTRVHPQGRS